MEPALNAETKVGVIGAGAMGAGIAQVALANGHPVVLLDTSSSALDRARAGLEKAFAREVEKGRLTAEAASNAFARLTIADSTQDLASLREAGLVIEAVVERLDVKQALFGAVERNVRANAVLATNTSSLSVASIASACTRPERVLGIHFFNPAPVMPLVEIVPGVRTDEAIAVAVRALVDRWGKTTVRTLDTPGFIVNRVARPFYGESLRILEDGLADPATIDWALREMGGFRMGPFELMDFIGHDVNYVVTESVWAAMYYDARYRPSLTQKRLLEAGLLGRKSGRGFYTYGEGSTPPAPTKDAALADAIVLRVVAMLVNEAAEAVRLRVATPADIELAMTRGVNYPRGLLAWGNAIQPERILAELDRLRALTGEERYRASPLLRECVESHRPLPT